MVCLEGLSLCPTCDKTGHWSYSTHRRGWVLSGDKNQKWLRLFEQLSPIYKWTPGELRKVQSCPRRRSALATNRPTRWATRGTPGTSSYAACFIGGNVLRYFSFGVRRSRLL